MRRIPLLLAIPAAAFAASAFAGALQEAEQFLDQAAPLHCEVLTMRYQAEALPAKSAARDELMTLVYQRAAQLDRDMAPAIRRFEAARAILAPDERARLDRHAAELLADCSRKASATYHVEIPIVPSAAGARPMPAPYAAAPIEKSMKPAARPGGIQTATPQPPS